jgi:hypothetical protein
MRMTADEVIQRSEIERQERSEPNHQNYRPLYSKERVRRRALCEALLEGIADDDLLALREIFAGFRRQSEERFRKVAN